MALMRYIGPYDEVRVSVAGIEFGPVEKDGSIAVPDELAQQVVWNEHWEDASKDAAAKKSSKAEARKDEV